MARADHYKGIERFCIMCKKTIPEDRKKDAVTCSKECSTARKNYLRSRQDATQCRYCNKPSTPEERARFHKWRKTEMGPKNDIEAEEFYAWRTAKAAKEQRTKCAPSEVVEQ